MDRIKNPSLFKASSSSPFFLASQGENCFGSCFSKIKFTSVNKNLLARHKFIEHKF